MSGGRIFSPIEMLERLIAFDTTSSLSNLALIEFVEDYLRGHGVTARRSGDVTDKANLYATIGPEAPGGIVLSGHSDVVPVADQTWSSEPFRLTPRDGRLYGRGTADMKGFLAVALALVPKALEADLRRPLHIAISYDEEVGCLGAPKLIEHILAAGPRPAVVIVGEPSEMKPVAGHKGIGVYRTTVTGRAAHSAQTHRAASAIYGAARLIAYLESEAEARRQGPQAEGFEPPYTTFNVGLIEGGTAHNIVPRSCSFTWQVRTVPGEETASVLSAFREHAKREVLPLLQATAPESAIETDCIADVPGLLPETDSPAEDLVRRLTGANRSGFVSFAAEAGMFQRAGVPTVICGPGCIDQAHQPDEFVEISQLERCADFITKLIDWAAKETD